MKKSLINKIIYSASVLTLATTLSYATPIYGGERGTPKYSEKGKRN